uniref:Uncharacterized protein n=1 Tax=Aegilops tauschii subsp. strangulata TaxID=200361 RepID=A0A453FSR1_AEGTS
RHVRRELLLVREGERVVVILPLAALAAAGRHPRGGEARGVGREERPSPRRWVGESGAGEARDRSGEDPAQHRGTRGSGGELPRVNCQQSNVVRPGRESKNTIFLSWTPAREGESLGRFRVQPPPPLLSRQGLQKTEPPSWRGSRLTS